MTEIHPFRLHADDDETANLFAGWMLPCHESLTGDEHNDGDIRSSVIVGSALDTITFAAPTAPLIMMHEMDLARLTPFPTSPMPLPTPSPVPMSELTYAPVAAATTSTTTPTTVDSLVCDEDFKQIEQTFFRAHTKHITSSHAPIRRKRKYTARTRRIFGRRTKKLVRTRLTDEKITPHIRATSAPSASIAAGTWMTLCPDKVAIFSNHEKPVIYGSSPQTQMISQNEVFFIYDISYIYPCSTHTTVDDRKRYDGAQFQHPIDAYFMCFSSERTELCFVLANAVVASTVPTCVYYSNSMRCIIPIEKCHLDKNTTRTFIKDSLNSFFWLHIIRRCASPSLGELFSTCLQHGVLFAPTTQVELHSDFDFNPALVESILWMPPHESSKYFDPFNEPNEQQQLEKNNVCFLSITFNVWSLYKDFRQLPLFIQHFLTHGCVLHDMCKVVDDDNTIATTTTNYFVSQQFIRTHPRTPFYNALCAKKHASVTMTILWYMKSLFGDSRFNCRNSIMVAMDNETPSTFVAVSEKDRLRMEAIHAFMYEKFVRRLHPYNVFHHVPLWLRMLERERYPQTILNGIEYDVPCFKVESDNQPVPTVTALNVHYTVVSDRLNERREFKPIVGGWIFDRTDAQLIDAIRHMHATSSSGKDDIENTCTVVLADKEKVDMWAHLTSCADDRFSRRVLIVTSGLLSAHDDTFAGCMAQYPTMILCTIDMLELFTQRLQTWRTRVRNENWIISRFLSTLESATYALKGVQIVRTISTCMKACDCLPLWIACALPASYTELESFFVFHVILMILRTSDTVASASPLETSHASVPVVAKKNLAESTQDAVIAFALLLGSAF